MKATPTIDNSFARKVCINLDRRPDRWEAMQQKFAEQNILTVERLSAVDAKLVPVPEALSHMRPQDFGCTMSHLNAVKEAKAAGASEVMIFEDDAFFDADFATRFPEFIEQVPDDWHMLFLGAYHFAQPIPVAPNIVKTVETLTAHAYVVRDTLYDAFIALNENPPAIVDRNNLLLQQKFNCYCFEPNLVGQESGYSDIMEEDMPEKPLAYPFPIPNGGNGW
ncbi:MULTISPECIES: glycosyltransferase family 25 protein [Paraburkholderia]|uniref:Glycosyltransferase involved in LPS biosynthesis, GR25 family n=1 Tax=Paraburkholderia megapolitana TaxID=420953 RepID=A0A1I3RNZ1_9BURK|nr:MULTISPECIES: glycosyltransferase family 25 protein [Paraburkholderia]MCX4165227.1 glycosyltransferase family 25 protein [Paraburkholderia megapolitana]MDN7160719.1 glycosyltransferase family 25 protein [Paraburkholderia sp. CHISQ3]MDQ6497766.1 glycosyltransferase family 25 protein [Paraburkholderia megapolitana]QDQ83930.1 glycosyl transferase [Paraburkholderia megapolitana]SFJ46916.1 Glycosyltransferase involved in LPS biosynthesis, GR25 family [Paraburkholderia megapolitana]